MAFLQKDMLVIVDPFIFLEVDFPGDTFAWQLYSPKALVVDVEVHLRIYTREQMPIVHHRWDEMVVKEFITLLQLQRLAHVQELRNDLPGTDRLEEHVRDLLARLTEWVRRVHLFNTNVRVYLIIVHFLSWLSAV